MTQPQINDDQLKAINDAYTAAISVLRSTAKLKGLHIERIITVPYVKRKRPEDRAQAMIRRV